MTCNRCFLISLFLFMYSSTMLNAQVTCAGSFGDNIFGAGDFGSGTENIVSNVTGIAPGYTYTTQTPPSDGSYIITNDMAKWSSNYGTWINIQDNSDDPRGYMMVVNASYSPGKFYEQSIDSLCPNTTFEFSADIINLISRPTTGHSLPDLDFLIDDSVRYSTGEIPQDEKWHKHGFTFTLEPGKTSIKLTLVNKAPGGTGNDLALDNITFRPCGPDSDPDLVQTLYFCEDNTMPGAISTKIDSSLYYLQWQTTQTPGLDWKDVGEVNQTRIEQDLGIPGTYFYRYKVSNSAANLNNLHCVSFSDVVTAEVLPIQYEIWDTICAGNSREFNGQLLTDAGEYTASHVSSHGCDSVVTLYLEVVEKQRLDFDVIYSDPLCHNGDDGRIEVFNVQGGYSPYDFILENDTNQTGFFQNIWPGIKIVQVSDHFGCTDSTVLELVNPGLFELYSIPDTQLTLGEPLTIELEANQAIATVVSEPDILKDCTDCNTVTIVPAMTSEVRFTATNENGCSSTKTIFIEVDDENLPVSFPNAFSPNGDGVNDDFRIITPTYLIRQIVSAKIVDRWGNVVHTYIDPLGASGSMLWDGEIDNKSASPGVYAYVCEVELINGETRLFAGEITVVK